MDKRRSALFFGPHSRRMPVSVTGSFLSIGCSLRPGLSDSRTGALDIGTRAKCRLDQFGQHGITKALPPGREVHGRRRCQSRVSLWLERGPLCGRMRRWGPVIRASGDTSSEIQERENHESPGSTFNHPIVPGERRLWYDHARCALRPANDCLPGATPRRGDRLSKLSTYWHLGTVVRLRMANMFASKKPTRGVRESTPRVVAAPSTTWGHTQQLLGVAIGSSTGTGLGVAASVGGQPA